MPFTAIAGDFLRRDQQLGTWIHAAIRWDGVTKALFLDGQLSSAHAAAERTLLVGDVVLGADQAFGSQISPFPGLVDDVRIYDAALTDDEIQRLANNALP